MNVRERAKTFEAFMSGNGGSISSENDLKQSQDESLTNKSGVSASNGQKDLSEEKHKPVPPPRKKKVPPRPSSPKLKHKTTYTEKNSQEVQKQITQQFPPSKDATEIQQKQPPEKPKAPRKPPPPRRGSYSKLPSQSLVSHIPHAKAKEFNPNNNTENSTSNHSEPCKEQPKTHSKETPGSIKITSVVHPKVPPPKPTRNSPRNSPKNSPRNSQNLSSSVHVHSVISSCEVKLSKDPQDSPSEPYSSKAHPKRPPPPKRTSSLTRKSKPPVPPKPKRPRLPATGSERKSATIPRTGSIESKEAITKKDDDSKELKKKTRSLTSPLAVSEWQEVEPTDDEDKPSMIENGAEEASNTDKFVSSDETFQLQNIQNTETQPISTIEDTKHDDSTITEISHKDTTPEPAKDKLHTNDADQKLEELLETSKDYITNKDNDSLIEDHFKISDDKTITNKSEVVHVDNDKGNNIESGCDENLKTNLENTELKKELCNACDSMTIDKLVEENLEDNLGIRSETQEDLPLQTEIAEDLVETSSKVDDEMKDTESNVQQPMETDLDASPQEDSLMTMEENKDLTELCNRTEVQMEHTEITVDVQQPMETDLDAEFNRKESVFDDKDDFEKVNSENETAIDSRVTTVCEDAGELQNEVQERPETLDSGKHLLVEKTSIDVDEICSNEKDIIPQLENVINKEECHQETDKVFSEEKNISNETSDSIVEEASQKPEEKDTQDLPSEVSPILDVNPVEEQQTGYLETSLDDFDDDFFEGEEEQHPIENATEDQQSEKLADKVQHSEEMLNGGLDEPYESDINSKVEEQDSSKAMTVNVTNEEETESIEQQSEEFNEAKEDEKTPQSAPCYENIVLVQKEENEDVDENEGPEPVRPCRPIRMKKQKKHSYENATVVQTQEKKNDEVEAATPEMSPPKTDTYENAVIINQTLSTKKDFEQEQTQEKKNAEVEASTPEMSPPKTDAYENAVIINQTLSTQEDFKQEQESTQTEEIKTVGENAKPAGPRYENVVFAHEKELDDDIYKVPRRKSFHSESPTTSLVRSTRSASVGSMERKKRVEPTIIRQSTKAEAEYVVPKPVSSIPNNEDTYVAPRSIRSSTEETYVTPRSIRTASDTDDVYSAPRSIRTTSTEEDVYVAPRSFKSSESEDTYVAPRSLRSSSPVDPGDTYAAPKATSTPSSEPMPTSETEYHVPLSTKTSQAEEDDGVYSVPVKRDSAVEQEDPMLDENPTMLRRATRSTVLTSREQLPSSIKSAPTKPPRSNLENAPQESEAVKPSPTPRTNLVESRPPPEAAPRASPRPKPRQAIQDNSSSEKIEKSNNKHIVDNDISEQWTASSKPKRPAPPRPKPPVIESAAEKDPGESDSGDKSKSPPRRPPPPLNRVSILSTEQEEVPPSPASMESSSESEDDEDQPPVPTGPPKKKTYHIAHEILSTERTFVNALTLCCEDCYGLIRKADVVPESTLNDIFKDLGNIYHLDLKFLQELEERMKTWEENERIGDIVMKYGHFLKMYTNYINHYDKAVNVLQDTMKENLQFAELVQQFQASEKCRNLSLETFMLKPVQRIPSYRLLLIDYLKHLPPDSEEYRDTKVALDIVSEVASLINESMKKVDNFERVLRIQESIVGNAEIVKPGREFIKEGTLQKLCRKDMQDRTFFLLTDVLLHTSAVSSGQYKLKGILPLLGIKVTLPDSPEFENEFNLISKTRSFTLAASTPAERDEWIEELTNAISALTKKKSTFLKSKDGAAIAPEDDKEVCQLGDKAPVWIQDTRVTMCLLCTDKFTVTNRRHHCRGCGKVVCGSCSDNLAPLAYLDYAPARVCDVCYDVLLKDQNKSIVESDVDKPPTSPISIGGDDLDRIHRKPAMFEILHRFKSGSKRNYKKSKIVSNRPTVRTEVVGHDSESQMSGYLKFKRTNKHGWKRLWFVLKGNVLYTYKASEDIVALETIPILGYVVQEATRTEGDEIQFQLKHAGLPPISFKTETEASAFRWTQQLRKATTL